MSEPTRYRRADWFVQCDEPGCTSRAFSLMCSNDRDAIESALACAVALGWYIAPDRFIRPRLDLCPEHRKENGHVVVPAPLDRR